jgi:hypothetical protein
VDIPRAADPKPGPKSWTASGPSRSEVVLDGPGQANAIAGLVAEMLTHLPDDISRWATTVEQQAALR